MNGPGTRDTRTPWGARVSGYCEVVVPASPPGDRGDQPAEADPPELMPTVMVGRPGSEPVGRLGALGRLGRPLVGRLGRPLVGRLGSPLVGRLGRLGALGRPLVGSDGRLGALGSDGRPLVGRLGRLGVPLPPVGSDGRPLVGSDGRLGALGRPLAGQAGQAAGR